MVSGKLDHYQTFMRQEDADFVANAKDDIRDLLAALKLATKYHAPELTIEQNVELLHAIAEAAVKNMAASKARVEELERQLSAQAQELERYRELLLAVVRKYPSESRHQTALRYIRNAENAVGGPVASRPIGADEKEGERR